jgi:hypothetical protein
MRNHEIRKAEALEALTEATEVWGKGFLVNVIMNQHSRPATKIKGLVKALRLGHEVAIGNQTDVLLVDGLRQDWSVLEDWAKQRGF